MSRPFARLSSCSSRTSTRSKDCEEPEHTRYHTPVRLGVTCRALSNEAPNAFLVLGDTNSCLAAIAAKRRRIPVFHREAGNRCSQCGWRGWAFDLVGRGEHVQGIAAPGREPDLGAVDAAIERPQGESVELNS